MTCETYSVATDAELHKDVCSQYGPHVYFLLAPEVRRVKIGTSYQPAKRFAEIQALSPVALFYLGCTPGGADVEARWHQRFRYLRLHGEWFRQDEGLLTAIAVADLVRKFNALSPGARLAWLALLHEHGVNMIPDSAVHAGGNRVRPRGVDTASWLDR